VVTVDKALENEDYIGYLKPKLIIRKDLTHFPPFEDPEGVSKEFLNFLNDENYFQVIKYLDIPNGESIAYLEVNQGDKVLILIHPNVSSSIIWMKFIPYFKNTHIYAIDMRGFGHSSYKN